MSKSVPIEIKMSEWFHGATPADAQREFVRIRYIMSSRGLLKGKGTAKRAVGRTARVVQPVTVASGESDA